MVARESVCEHASLELEIIPAVLRCRACEHEWEIEQPPFWCPRCGGGDVAPVRGEELEVESIEIEEAQCIARM
jgi:hydrogenase nickel incorporation protein HypA/HybF